MHNDVHCGRGLPRALRRYARCGCPVTVFVVFFSPVPRQCVTKLPCPREILSKQSCPREFSSNPSPRALHPPSAPCTPREPHPAAVWIRAQPSDDDVDYYKRWRLKLEGETENTGTAE